MVHPALSYVSPLGNRLLGATSARFMPAQAKCHASAREVSCLHKRRVMPAQAKCHASASKRSCLRKQKVMPAQAKGDVGVWILSYSPMVIVFEVSAWRLSQRMRVFPS